MQSQNVIKEGCVESLEECVLAEQLGANRLELCADLAQDGLTPSKELIEVVQAKVNIPIKVMIRPRGGNFCYSAEELEQMKAEIEMCKELGVFGVVFGVTTPDDELDIDVIRELAQLSKPLDVCVHKAIDSVKSPLNDFKRLLNEVPEVDAVLTSGGEATAAIGASVLKEMNQLGGDKLKVVVAGKVSKENLSELQAAIGASEFHGKKIVGDLN